METVEKVHLFAIKRLLRLSNKTPSIIVYGESGKVPAGRQLPDTQAETPETESRSAAFLGVPVFPGSGGKGQGILGWKSERAATKARLRRSVVQSGSRGRKEVS